MAATYKPVGLEIFLPGQLPNKADGAGLAMTPCNHCL